MSGRVKDSVCFVTGSNRGIGRALVEELLLAGVAKVYASARNADALRDLAESHKGRVATLILDVTNDAQVRAAAKVAQDTQILINNAAVNHYSGVISAADMTLARNEMEVNYFGLMNVTRSFAKILKENGGGALVNVSSAGAFVGIPLDGTYCATKAAVHSLTQSVRGELRAQGTLVMGVYPGAIDTDMAAGADVEKETARHVAQQILLGIDSGTEDLYPDEASRDLIARLHEDGKAVEKEWSTMLPRADRRS